MAFPGHSIQLRPKTNAGFTALSAGLGRMIMLTKCLSKLLFFQQCFCHFIYWTNIDRTTKLFTNI